MTAEEHDRVAEIVGHHERAQLALYISAQRVALRRSLGAILLVAGAAIFEPALAPVVPYLAGAIAVAAVAASMGRP